MLSSNSDQKLILHHRLQITARYLSPNKKSRKAITEILHLEIQLFKLTIHLRTTIKNIFTPIAAQKFSKPQKLIPITAQIQRELAVSKEPSIHHSRAN